MMHIICPEPYHKRCFSRTAEDHLSSSTSDSSLLPPANEVWGKVIFLHLFVILFTSVGGWVSPHAPGSHYIRSCAGADTQLVWWQHTGNIKCMMG